MKRIVAFSVDHPWLTIGLVSLLTLVLGSFLPRIQLDTDPKNMLEKSATVRIANERVEQEFALLPDTIVVGVVSESSIFGKDTLGRLFALATAISSVEGVVARDVVSLATTNNAVLHGDDLQIRPVLRRPPGSDEEASAVRAEALANPTFVGRLFSEDGRAAAIYVPLEAGAEAARIADGIRGAIAQVGPPEHVYLAGDPIVSETIAVEVFRQLAIFSPLAGLFMIVALSMIFRNVRMVVAVMVISLISTVWTMGLHVALGLTVHLMSAMIPVFLMAIATDSVHIFNELDFSLRSGTPKRQAIVDSLAVVGRPVIFSDLTTAAGFAALASSTFPAIRLFGIFVAVGTVAILILSFTLVPALLSVADEKRLAGGAERAEPSRSSSRLLAALGRFAVARSGAIALVGLALFAAAGAGISQIRINNNMVDWFGASSEVRTADRMLNQHLAGTSLGYVVVRGPDGIFSQPEGLRFLEGLGAWLANESRVGKVVSLADVVKQSSVAVRGGESFREVPDSRETIAQLLLLIGSGSRPQDLDNFVDYRAANANLYVQLETWDVDAFQRVIASSQEYLAQHPLDGVRLQPAGMAYFNLIWNDEMLMGMVSSFAWGLVFVLVLLMWEYRSLTVGVIAFLPLFLTTFFIYGVLGIIGKDFDMPISVLSTLTLGLADDFAIHFVSRLKARLAEANSGTLDDALRWTIERPGLGIVRNAVVFSAAFVVMVFAGFSPYVTVGVLMASIMLLSSLATLLFLPALFRLFPQVLGPRERTVALVGASVSCLLWIWLAPATARADSTAEASVSQRMDVSQHMDAEEIVRREYLAYYYPGTDLRANVTMRLITKGGEVRERRLTMLRRNVGAGGADQRYLIFFQKPDDVRRTSFLVWKYPNRDDDRWLFLPAVELVRRIAASDERSSFVGSDFTYEDISGRDLSSDTRTLLRNEKLGEWACFVIESKPTGDGADYARRVTWIDAQTFLPRKEEYYDQRSRPLKVFTGDEVAVVEGMPTLTRRSMKDLTTGHTTIVEMTEVDYDVGVSEDVFSERYLRRPPPQWIRE
jgi:predicted RND superfamily exporter protein